MEITLNNLILTLPENWVQADGGGSLVFANASNRKPSPLYISYFQKQGDTTTIYTEEMLLSFAEKIANSYGDTILHKETGQCNFGFYGRVDFRGSNYSFGSVWHIADKKDLVMALYLCAADTNETDLDLEDAISLIKSIKPKD